MTFNVNAINSNYNIYCSIKKLERVVQLFLLLFDFPILRYVQLYLINRFEVFKSHFPLFKQNMRTKKTLKTPFITVFPVSSFLTSNRYLPTKWHGTCLRYLSESFHIKRIAKFIQYHYFENFIMLFLI